MSSKRRRKRRITVYTSLVTRYGPQAVDLNDFTLISNKDAKSNLDWSQEKDILVVCFVVNCSKNYRTSKDYKK